MANLKISQLPSYLNANVHAGDSIPIVDSLAGELKQISIGQLDLRYQGVPDGGSTQQVLAKASGTNKDVYWRSLDKNSVGLGLVDNTSDINKPISTATQSALNLKANTSALASKADISFVTAQVATKQDALGAGVDGYVLTLVAGVPTWAVGGGGGGLVTSVFGRAGVVTAQVGDYDKTMIGLDQVDNTSDLDKPISTLTQTALNLKQASLPGGTDGYILSLVAGSPAWIPAPSSLPTGGTTGQVLYKISGTNYDVGWITIDPGMIVSGTQSLAAAATATMPSNRRKRIKLQSTGGDVQVFLPAGTVDGEELYVQGASDVNPVTLVSSSSLYLGGGDTEITLSQYTMLYFIWDLGNTRWVLSGGNV